LKKCNELPNITDADVINAFIYGMTCEALVHSLSCETPCTLQELLDIATQYATNEKVIRPTLAGKPRPLATSVVAMVLTTLPHLSDTTTSGTRTESAVGRRWSPRPTTSLDLSAMGDLLA
jgi:hypothetical protein